MIARSLITPYLPLFTLASGIIIIGLGIATLMKIVVPLPLKSIRLSKGKGYLGLFLYGIAYGMSTISCSAPIFFSIIFSALVAGGHIDAALTFIIYASGMGIPLIVITYLIAKAKKKILNKIRDSMPLVQKFSGLLLLIIGIYLIIYSYSGNTGIS